MPYEDEDEDEDEDTKCKRCCREWSYRYCDTVEIIQTLCILILIVITWLIAYSIFKEEAGPYSEPFSLLVMFGTAKALGILVEMVNIPPIMAMVTVGVLMKNIGFVDLSKRYLVVAAVLRKLTLLSVALPAALSVSIDPIFVKTKMIIVLLLVMLPSIVEVLTMCLIAYLLLGLPVLWALLLGFLESASAPVIVVPCLFKLEAMGYGNVNGIFTLVTAASIIDVIESLTLFGLVFGILTAAPGEVIKNLVNCPVGILISFAYGISLGIIAQYVPHDDDWHLITLRTSLIAGGSLLALFGSNAIGYPGSAGLGNFFFAFIANIRWMKLGWRRHHPVRENFKLVWRFFEPISFSLIGMEIDFKNFDPLVALFGTIAVTVSTLVHFLASVAVTTMFRYTTKESIFVGLSWISKASVQAALGPLALDYAREVNIPEAKHYAEIILSVTVICIVLTVPIGTILMMNLGPKLLTKEVPFDQQIRKSGVALITAPDLVYRRETRALSHFNANEYNTR